MSVREALEALYQQHGHLTPEIVVEAARDPANFLHAHVFADDNATAAEKHRLNIARKLIKSVPYLVRPATEAEEALKVRAYQSVPVEAGRTAYRHVEDIQRDPLTSRLLLKQMEREWKSLHRRYQAYGEWAGIVLRDVAPEVQQQAS